MYVGMTRAKQELYLMHAMSRTLYVSRLANPPSRFLADIEAPQMTVAGLDSLATMAGAQIHSTEPRYVPELNEGDGIKHQIFGFGTVVELEGDMATIYFKGKGTKKLDIGYAPITKVE
jgi:DNA helicase-2/ATP-dependent DNA helicase PcrA